MKSHVENNSLCMIYKRFELWGHWKCPHKSPSPCNTCHTCVIIQMCVFMNHINTHTRIHFMLVSFTKAKRKAICSEKLTSGTCSLINEGFIFIQCWYSNIYIYIYIRLSCYLCRKVCMVISRNNPISLFQDANIILFQAKMYTLNNVFIQNDVWLLGMWVNIDYKHIYTLTVLRTTVKSKWLCHKYFNVVSHLLQATWQNCSSIYETKSWQCDFIP